MNFHKRQREVKEREDEERTSYAQRQATASAVQALLVADSATIVA